MAFRIDGHHTKVQPGDTIEIEGDTIRIRREDVYLAAEWGGHWQSIGPNPDKKNVAALIADVTGLYLSDDEKEERGVYSVSLVRMPPTPNKKQKAP